MSTYCTFSIDQLTLGVEVHRVQEVIRFQPTTRVPLADPIVRGLMNLRGQIVTALDLRRRLELPPSTSNKEPMNVILRTSDGPVSLLVDRIGDVLELDERTFELPPETLQGVPRELIRGVHKLPQSLLLILEIDSVLQMPVRRLSNLRGSDTAA